MAEYSASDVAKWFLNYNRFMISESDADLISNLKLQKLLYYAQGCYLALEHKPLFAEKIFAWEHGPVIEEVYQEYKNNRSNGIQFNEEYKNVFLPDDEIILREVYNVFAKYSAWGLRNMTHNEDPWKNTTRNGIITNDLIQKYFEQNYIV